ncbi:MAG: EAL domain-containing protein [Lachnospiraceae bacterium]|nr:EAL domain-containing protein [Lachnospiraceae bacterium]
MSQSIVEEVRKALETHGIRPWFQPQYDTVTGKLVSAEALARWINEDGSITPPDDFIPELEKTDAINALDWYIAEEACKTMQELQGNAIPIAVNFSRRHVQEEDFSNKLTSLLLKYSIPRDLFEVEITESALVNEKSNILQWVGKVKDTRVKVAIDDFGSGLSSLQFVKDIPVDVLKIDRSLLSGNCQPEKERIVLESIFYFANRLHIDTIAEGVETSEQLGFLRTCNCKRIQGFLFGKPMPKEEFIKLCQTGARKKTDETDILSLQSPASATQLLLSAIFQRYPLVIFANLSRDSYYMMAYDNFTAKTCSSSGSFDRLIEHGSTTMHEEDREAFKNTFSRSNLMAAHAAGVPEVSLIARQIGDDGVCRRVEITDYFVKSPSSNDVLVISLNSNLRD